MKKNIIIAYDLSAIHNHSYFFDDAPEKIFCKKCGCCVNSEYIPVNFKTGNKADISATYDRKFIVSLRFKEYIETLKYNVDFITLNKTNTLFLIKPRNVIEFSAYQIDDYCENCHQYFDQVVPIPAFFEKTGKILDKGIFFTSIYFGSGKEKSPSIILGVETAEIIKDAVKSFKFRGADISKIYG